MQLKKRNSKKTIIIALSVAVVAVLIITGIVIGLNIDKASNQVIYRGIMVSSNPNKTVYYVGEEFDPSGMKVQVLATNNETSYFIDYKDPELKVTGFDSSVANEMLVLTVTYREFTTTCNVTIKEPEKGTPYLTSIRLSDNFTTTYSLDWWNTYGMVLDDVKVICIYSDGTEKEFPMESSYCYGVDYTITSPETQVITVKYSDNGVWAETTVPITITN